MNLRFFVSRFLLMSPAEMLYRVFQHVRRIIERFIYLFGLPRMRLRDVPVPEIRLSIRGWNRKLILKKADRLCRGNFEIFSLKNLDLRQGVDYHVDYSTGRRAPRRPFGLSINYRDSERVGDIKYIWELNRHLFLFTLARAYALTHSQKYIRVFSGYLNAWLEQNPFPRGVNWASALDVSIRLINWTLSWLIIHDAVEERLRDRWLKSIYLHCLFIDRNFSAYSSANNHVIGEAAGLFMASTVFSHFGPARHWLRASFRRLERECRRQTYSDGVHREQSVWYAHYVLDFLLLALAVSPQGPYRFSRTFHARVRRMARVLAAFSDKDGHMPNWGDEDGGLAFDANQRETGVFTSLVKSAALLAGTAAPPPPDEKTRIYLDLAGRPESGRSIRGVSEQPPPDIFPYGGYVLLGKDLGKSSEQKLVFDAGSLGFLSLAAHGHADALSFTFSFHGFPLFIDPGTGTYYASDRWRAYFRSTAAHNTVRLDGRDQSRQAGRVMWGKRARVRLLAHTPLRTARAEHDGYGLCTERVTHNREIRYHQKGDMWEILDHILTRKTHRIELFFHLSPECRAEIRKQEAIIDFPGGVCRMALPVGTAVSLHRGEESPPCGWFSPAFDLRVPTITIKAERMHTGDCLLVTTFSVRGQTRRGRTTRS